MRPAHIVQRPSGVICVLSCMLAAAGIGSAANAGVVVETFGTTGWTAQYDDSLAPFLDLTFDGLIDTDTDGINDTIVIEKSAQFNNLNPILIQFIQVGASVIKHFAIEDESLTNLSGFTWTDFHMEVIDSGDAKFNQTLTANSGGPLPIGFSISPFTNAVFSADSMKLDIDGGTVPNGTGFFPGSGATDGKLFIDCKSGNGESTPFTVFTLKEFPTVPSPAALAALAIGGLLRSRRRS